MSTRGRRLSTFRRKSKAARRSAWSSVPSSPARRRLSGESQKFALEMSRSSVPPGLHFGWTDHDMLSASWSYLAFGEGNVPWKVRELIHRAEKDPSKRPRVIVG